MYEDDWEFCVLEPDEETRNAGVPFMVWVLNMLEKPDEFDVWLRK